MIFQIENLHRNSICYAFGCFFCTSVCHGAAIHFPQLLGSLSHCSLSASTCEQQRGLHMIFEDRGDIKKTDHSNDDSTAHLSWIWCIRCIRKITAPKKGCTTQSETKEPEAYVSASLWWEMLWELGCLKLSDQVAYRLPIQTLHICSCMG